MRKRTLLTIALVGLAVIIALMLFILVYLLRSGDAGEQTVQLPQKKTRVKEVPDPFGGKEVDAVALVQNHKVPDPERIERILELRKKIDLIDNPPEEPKDKKKKGKKKKTKEEKEAEEAMRVELAELEAQAVPKVTVQSLIEKNFLERKLGLSFLKRENWRAVHFDLDAKNRGAKEGVGDPFYEVQLEYVDGLVRVGPVWLVNVQTKQVLARNEMAEIFEMGLADQKRLKELEERPEGVVKALTNHRFESGIELGAVLLLHFIANIDPSATRSDGKDPNNRIVGWTVAHDFGDDYVAYFQWIEDGERKVARWRFDWEKKELEPLGLLAIDITSEHTLYETALHDGSVPVSIWPDNNYDREKSFLPREERWLGALAQACPMDAFKARCNGLAAVLEQENFIRAVHWLIADTENNRLLSKKYLITEGEQKDEYQPDKVASCLKEHPVQDESGNPKPAAALAEGEMDQVIGACIAAEIHDSFKACQEPRPDADGDDNPEPPDCRWTFNPVQVNVNTASKDQLKNAVGSSVAKKIIEHRENKGNFLKTDDLILVDGIEKEDLKDVTTILTTDPKLTGKVPVEYQWIIGGQKGEFKFSYNPKDESITPLDRISNWAYWSVRIRS